jgi:hypothetical protein
MNRRKEQINHDEEYSNAEVFERKAKTSAEREKRRRQSFETLRDTRETL